MTWSRRSYAQPSLADYGRALGRWWALLVIGVAAINGAVLAGPYFGILRGLAMVPAIWLAGPMGWPLLRADARRQRREAPPSRAENWRLPAGVFAGYLVVMAAVMAAAGGRAAWFEFVPMVMMAALVVAGGLLWVPYALERERRHELTFPGATPPFAVRLLRDVEDRCGPLGAPTGIGATP